MAHLDQATPIVKPKNTSDIIHRMAQTMHAHPVVNRTFTIHFFGPISS